MYVLKNDAGEVITGKRKLKKEEYGTGKIKYEEPEVAWRRLRTEYADSNGFDTRNVEENGHYLIEMRLPRGTVIIRYGPESGNYTAPDGTDYDDLSLPYVRSTVEYHKYKVRAKSLKVYCLVLKGVVAPMFDSMGGAVQYYHPDSNILELVKGRVLERVEL